MNKTTKLETENVGRVASNAGLGSVKTIDTAPRNRQILLFKGYWYVGEWLEECDAWDGALFEEPDRQLTHWAELPPNP